jgi:hypothetical protein
MDDAPSTVGDATLYADWISSLDARSKDLATQVAGLQALLVAMVLLVAATIYLTTARATKEKP